jgi:hypothetical protein
MWRAHFGRGSGPVVWQTAKWMNEWTTCSDVISHHRWFASTAVPMWEPPVSRKVYVRCDTCLQADRKLFQCLLLVRWWKSYVNYCTLDWNMWTLGHNRLDQQQVLHCLPLYSMVWAKSEGIGLQGWVSPRASFDSVKDVFPLPANEP